jgi:hypothetical protein
LGALALAIPLGLLALTLPVTTTIIGGKRKRQVNHFIVYGHLGRTATIGSVSAGYPVVGLLALTMPVTTTISGGKKKRQGNQFYSFGHLGRTASLESASAGHLGETDPLGSANAEADFRSSQRNSSAVHLVK